MSQCQVCNLNKSDRLSAEKQVLAGGNVSQISRELGVSSESLRNHMNNHVSRQLIKSYEMREAIENAGLVTEIQDLLKRSKHILRRAERDDKLSLALGAIRETRGTLELMARICSTIFQIEQAQLHAQQEQEQDTSSVEFQEGLSRLSDAELTLYMALTDKMAGERDDDVALSALSEIRGAYTPTPEPKRPRRRVTSIEVDETWDDSREQQAQEEEKAPVFAPEPLPTLEHVPLDLESLELDEDDKPSRSTWGSSKQSSLETALRTGTLRTPYTAGIRGRD